MINPLWLRTFCTLAEVGHFTRTAERLFMTQSGVSQHVRKLEDQLGQPLLIREGKQFSLTDAGVRLAQQGAHLLAEMQALEQSVREDPPYEGVVRVMSPGSLGLKLYPLLLELQVKHPQLVIDYRFAPNQDVARAVAEQSIDIGLMTQPPTAAEVSSAAIAREALLLVTPASIQKPDWQALTELGFIDHPDGAYHASLLLGANFSQFQHISDFACRGFSNQIGLILEPVKRGLGFTVLPAYAVEAFEDQALIRVHTLAQPVHEEVYRLVNRSRPLARRMQTVLGGIEEALTG